MMEWMMFAAACLIGYGLFMVVPFGPSWQGKLLIALCAAVLAGLLQFGGVLFMLWQTVLIFVLLTAVFSYVIVMYGLPRLEAEAVRVPLDDAAANRAAKSEAESAPVEPPPAAPPVFEAKEPLQKQADEPIQKETEPVVVAEEKTALPEPEPALQDDGTLLDQLDVDALEAEVWQDEPDDIDVLPALLPSTGTAASPEQEDELFYSRFREEEAESSEAAVAETDEPYLEELFAEIEEQDEKDRFRR